MRSNHDFSDLQVGTLERGWMTFFSFFDFPVVLNALKSEISEFPVVLNTAKVSLATS